MDEPLTIAFSIYLVKEIVLLRLLGHRRRSLSYRCGSSSLIFRITVAPLLQELDLAWSFP